MKVECITNLCKDIPEEVYKGLHGYSYNTEYDIEVGQLFIVYGIFTMKKNLWYLVEVKDLLYPMFYPHQLFKIIDGRLSKYWVAKEGKDDYDNNEKVINFGFKELVEDEYFYGEFIEDKPENVLVFEKYKELMDKEFL